MKTWKLSCPACTAGAPSIRPAPRPSMSGRVSSDRKHWLATSETFFLPVLALSVIFRAKFRAAMDQAGLLAEIPSGVWQQDWVVHCQPVGDGTQALNYLARYVFRVAIANSRIRSCQDGIVTFSFRDKETGQPRQVERWARQTGFIGCGFHTGQMAKYPVKHAGEMGHFESKSQTEV